MTDDNIKQLMDKDMDQLKSLNSKIDNILFEIIWEKFKRSKSLLSSMYHAKGSVGGPCYYKYKGRKSNFDDELSLESNIKKNWQLF